MVVGESRQGCLSIAYAEAEAIKFRLQYAHDGGILCIEAGTGCRKVIDMLVNGTGTRERTNAQIVVDDILALARNFVFLLCRISSIRVANAIAQTSLNLRGVKVWMEDHPLEDFLPYRV